MTLSKVSDLKAYLVGTWSLSRQVSHKSVRPCRRGLQVIMRAQVSITQEADYLLYKEVGRLYHATYEGPFQQSYFLKVDTKKPWRAHVLFADERLFFVLDWATGHHAFHHHCGGDSYEATLWAHLDTIYCQWRVEGPRKSYVMKTVLCKSFL